MVRRRPSKTAEALRRRERDIVAGLSPMQRALRALELGERSRYLLALAAGAKR